MPLRGFVTCAFAMGLLLGCPGDDPHYDFDGDGWQDGDDCEPQDDTINPGADEQCSDGIDNDCDGAEDLLDRDCNHNVSTSDGWAGVVSGLYHSCGQDGAGVVRCWGCSSPAIDLGQCAPDDTVVDEVVAGDNHACGLTEDGAPRCWGSNDSHQLDLPVDERFVRLGAGGRHTCGIRADGSVDCWGDPSGGQCSPPGGSFAQVVGGDAFSCGHETPGGVICWGCGSPGADEQACEPPVGSFVAVTAGFAHACALDADGEATCWGNDAWGQASPIAGPFVHLSAGAYHTCGRTADGGVRCWGCGVAGDEADDQICEPPDLDYETVDAHYQHTCGLVEGRIICFGVCAYGECTPP